MWFYAPNTVEYYFQLQFLCSRITKQSLAYETKTTVRLGVGGNHFFLGYNLLLPAKGNYNNQTTNSQETLQFHQFSC